MRDHVEASHDEEVDRQVYAKTVLAEDSECRKGWLVGPLSPDELTATFAPLPWVPVPRFGITQGVDKHGKPKVRPIDDYSIMFHNSCVTCTEKIPVAGVDAIANYAKLWSELILMARRGPTPTWRLSVKLSDGTVLAGSLHPAFRQAGKLVGKCVDLGSAYRQVPIAPTHRHLAVVWGE